MYQPVAKAAALVMSCLVVLSLGPFVPDSESIQRAKLRAVVSDARERLRSAAEQMPHDPTRAICELEAARLQVTTADVDRSEVQPLVAEINRAIRLATKYQKLRAGQPPPAP